MVTGLSNFILGVIAGGLVVAIYAFTRGFFQHIGVKTATATISRILPDSDTDFTDKELRKRTLELHGEIAEFQTRKERQRSRNFWNENVEEMDKEDMMEKHRQQSIRRKELKGEFLKRFGARLEMILQEYEKRGIEPDEDMKELDSLRWWAQRGETSRILPTLRDLAQRVEVEEEE
jgi:hypothetical protein